MLLRDDGGLDPEGLSRNGIAWLVRWSGSGLRRLQTGHLQTYAAALVMGAFALLVAYMLFTLR